MYRLGRLAGYAALLLTPAVLLTDAFTVTDPAVGTLGVTVGVVLAGTVTAAAEREFVSMADPLAVDRAAAVDALSVAVGALLTYALSVHAGLGAVVASALVGLLVGLGLPRVAVPAYCGSFVGMASPAVFPGLEYVALAGVVAGLAFVATDGIFDGFGGKLGTTALFGCLVAVPLAGLEYAPATAPPWGETGLIVPVAVAGAVATVVVSVDLEAGPVVASGLVGLAAGVGFPLVAPELGGTLAAVAFCASFVGMSSPDRLETRGVAVAGAICGLVFLAVTPALEGAGGKLGTIAFIACVATVGAWRVLEAVRWP